MTQIKQIVPGLLLASGVAIIAKLLAQLIPLLGAATIAILLGIVLGNSVFKQILWKKGIKFSEAKLLELSIFLLGFTLSIHAIAALGMSGLLFVILQMGITVFMSIYFGRKLKFNDSITLLMASGNVVCGSSAIAATAPAIQADDESKGIVITIVNLMGTVLMLIFPLLTLIIYQHDAMPTAALIGGTLQSVGQVVASGNMVSATVAHQATIYKIIRIIFLVVVVFVLGRVHQSRSDEKQYTTTKKPALKLIPWYVLAFFLACLCNSFGFIPEVVITLAKTISGWLEIIALAAIGLGLNLSSLYKQGKKIILYGLYIGIFQIISAVILIWILIK